MTTTPSQGLAALIDFCNQAHQLATFIKDGTKECEDMWFAFAELIEEMTGDEWGNGGEFWLSETKELPDNKFQVGWVLNADDHEDDDLGILAVGQFNSVDDEPAFEIEKIVRVAAVGFDKTEGDYFWRLTR